MTPSTLLLCAVLLQDAEIDRLIEQLGAEEIETRESALKNLVELGGRAVPALEKAARSADEETRARSGQALVLRASMDRFEAKGGVVADVGWIRVKAEENPERVIGGSVGDDVNAALSKDRSKAIPAVRNLLDHDSMAVRYFAVQRAGELHAFEVGSDLIRVAQKDEQAYIRVEATNALGTLGIEQARDALIDLTREPSQSREAYRALAYLALPETEDVLARALEKHPEFAILGFARIGAKHRAPDIVAILARQNDFQVAGEALNALAQLRATEHLPAISRKLDSWRVQETAVEALGRLGDARAVEALRNRLDDPDERLRRTAALALVRLGQDDGLKTELEEYSGEVAWESNRLRATKAFESLFSIRLSQRRSSGPLKDVAAAWAKETGLRIEGTADDFVHVRLRPSACTLGDALAELARWNWGVFVDDTGIRILPRETAEEGWKQWMLHRK